MRLTTHRTTNFIPLEAHFSREANTPLGNIPTQENLDNLSSSNIKYFYIDVLKLNEEEPILKKEERRYDNAERDTEPQMRRIRIHKNKEEKRQSFVFVTKRVCPTKEAWSTALDRTILMRKKIENRSQKKIVEYPPTGTQFFDTSDSTTNINQHGSLATILSNATLASSGNKSQRQVQLADLMTRKKPWISSTQKTDLGRNQSWHIKLPCTIRNSSKNKGTFWH